jgi:DNA-binding NtrC family response regulator
LGGLDGYGAKLAVRARRSERRLIVPNHLRVQHHSAAPPSHATVLLADREPLYRWFVAESLRGSGVDVVSCGSLEEAEGVLRGPVAPDLLIVDGVMLEGRGREALGAIRASAGAVPCLVLDSGGDLSQSRLDSVKIAEKPVDCAAIVTLVTSQLRPDILPA